MALYCASLSTVPYLPNVSKSEQIRDKRRGRFEFLKLYSSDFCEKIQLVGRVRVSHFNIRWTILYRYCTGTVSELYCSSRCCVTERIEITLAVISPHSNVRLFGGFENRNEF